MLCRGDELLIKAQKVASRLLRHGRDHRANARAIEWLLFVAQPLSGSFSEPHQGPSSIARIANSGNQVMRLEHSQRLTDHGLGPIGVCRQFADRERSRPGHVQQKTAPFGRQRDAVRRTSPMQQRERGGKMPHELRRGIIHLWHTDLLPAQESIVNPDTFSGPMDNVVREGFRGTCQPAMLGPATMVRRIRHLLLVSLFLLTAGVSCSKSHERIDSKQAHALVQEGAKLVDVRTPAEFAEKHLPGAINVPVQELETRIKELEPKDQTLILYCRSGHRSGIAYDQLKKQGFTKLFDLGSISAW